MSLASSSNPIVLPFTGRDFALSDSGNYYTALTPTPGTGIIGHAAPTTFDETKPYLLLYNAGALNIYPSYLRLFTTVASVGGTGTRFTMAIDTGNRLSSGGTALTPGNTNGNSGNKSAAAITVGAVLATAASAVRRVLFSVVSRPAVIDQVGDLIQFSWGSGEQTDSGMITGGTAQLTSIYNFGPLVIGPNQSFLIHEWKTSQSTGPTFEVELGYVEK